MAGNSASNGRTPDANPPRSGIERFFLLLVLILVTLFVLKIMGVPIVQRSESTEIIEHPHR